VQPGCQGGARAAATSCSEIPAESCVIQAHERGQVHCAAAHAVVDVKVARYLAEHAVQLYRHLRLVHTLIASKHTSAQWSTHSISHLSVLLSNQQRHKLVLNAVDGVLLQLQEIKHPPRHDVAASMRERQMGMEISCERERTRGCPETVTLWPRWDGGA
jgi:hypothetical protein